MDKETKKQKRARQTSRQIVALAGVVLLVLLYLVTLVVAFLDQSASGRLFWVCLFATIAVPLLIWVYTWMYGKLTGRSTMAGVSSSQSLDRADPAVSQEPEDQTSSLTSSQGP